MLNSSHAFTGQVGATTNKQTWRSNVYELLVDGETIDLSDPLLAVDISVTIGAIENSTSDDDWWGITSTTNPAATADLDNEKVWIIGPGFQWQFEVEDLTNIGAGTYRLRVQITIGDVVYDAIDGTVVLVEGN